MYIISTVIHLNFVIKLTFKCVILNLLTATNNYLSSSEKANLAITLVSSDDEVVANGTFFDYPNVSSIDQAKWEKIFQECFKSVKPTVSIISLYVPSQSWFWGLFNYNV